MAMSVINVKKENLKKYGYKDFQEWAKHPNHIYIGHDILCCWNKSIKMAKPISHKKIWA